MNNIEITYYNGFHPKSIISYNQPPYSYFVLYTSKVILSAVYTNDIAVDIPINTPCVVHMTVTITDTNADLTRKLDNVFEITLNAADILTI